MPLWNQIANGAFNDNVWTNRKAGLDRRNRGSRNCPKTVHRRGNPIPNLTEKMTQRLRLIRWRLTRLAGAQVSDRVAPGGQGPREFFDRA